MCVEAGMELVLGKHAGASVELHGVQPTGCMDRSLLVASRVRSFQED